MIKRAYLVVVSFLALISTVSMTCSTDIDEQTIENASVTQVSIITTETPVITPPETTAESFEIESSTTELFETEQETTVDEIITSNMTTETTLIAEDTPEEKTYTEDDLFYLAAAVCREAGGASEEIQLLVANVVINRVKSSFYPDTIYGVLTQHRQYGMMWKYGVSFPKEADEETIAHCYEVAERILGGEIVCPENVLFQAEFVQGSGIYKQFDGFYFCYYG